MNTDDYIEQRLLDQINWYDRKSQHNQRWFKRLQLTQIVLAALLPFLAGFANEQPWYALSTGGIGIAMAIAVAAQGLYQFERNWLEYRSTCESLRKEQFLFMTASAPYEEENPDRFQLLVQRVEGLISKENTRWAQHMAEQVDQRQTVSGG